MILSTANLVYLLKSPKLAFDIKQIDFLLSCSIIIGNESKLVVDIFIGGANDEDFVNKKGGCFPKEPQEQKDCRQYYGAHNNKDRDVSFF